MDTIVEIGVNVKFKSGGAIWIRMCEWVKRKSNWGHFVKGGKQKESELTLKNVTVKFGFQKKIL